MSKLSITKTDNDNPITQADIASGKLTLVKRNANSAIVQNKQRVNIFLDAATLDYFKAKARSVVTKP